MDTKELDYLNYYTVQGEIVDWFNSILPNIDNFPVNYVYVQRLPVLSDNMTEALSVVFTPTATKYQSDMLGDFVKLTFMLQYASFTGNSIDQLDAIRPLQYLLDEISKLKMSLKNDKMVLGFKGTMLPSMQSYDESQGSSVYSAMFELDYKHYRR